MLTDTALQNWQQQAMNLPILFETPTFFQQNQQAALAQWTHLDWTPIERVSYQDWPLCQETLAAEDAMMEAPLTYGVQAALTVADSHTTHNSKDSYPCQIVHAGNQTILTSVPTELREAGVIVSDLFEALTDYPELVERHLFSVVPALEDKLTAYQTAYLNGGLFIYIPDQCDLPISIDALLLQDSRFTQAFNKRVLIVAGQQSRLDYIERLQTEGTHPNSATITVEVIAQAGAQLKYCAIDHLSANTTAYIKRHATVANDATLNWAIGAMNAGDTILDTETYLNGQGAQSQLAIVATATQTQTQGIDAKIVNRGRHSIGHILQHGVVLDQATLTFNGIGLIEKQAKQADAQQESRLMMLSDQARGDANPILLIEEYEVTAGHAASVGQLDEQQLYYLMSRGLSRPQAEYLVVRGFLGSVIREMPTQKVREEIVAVIDRQLATLHAGQSQASQPQTKDVAQ